MLNENYAWHKAIKCCNGRKELSLATGIPIKCLTYYLNRPKALRNKPIDYWAAVAIEKATQSKVSRYELGSYRYISTEYRPGHIEEKQHCLPQLATITARIAQTAAIEVWIGNRQGVRNDLIIRSDDKQGDLIERIESGEAVQGKSAELAATIMGFKYSTYVRGKKVLVAGCHDLLLALDSYCIKIYPAYKLLSDSHEEQKHRLLDYLNG